MGGTLSILKGLTEYAIQAYPPKSKFSPDQMPDLTERVVIVTGANTGIGKETAKALLEHNARVYLAARSKEKAEVAIEDLKQKTGKEAIWLELDLASLASIRRAANTFLMKERELHILYNNAGVMAPPIDQLTADGYDMQFGTHVLGHFFFTDLLMPALIEGAKSMPDGRARIVTTSSAGAYFDTLHYDTFRDGPARRKLGTQLLYCQSKFGNVVVAREIARRYADKGILSFSCNPGNLSTELHRHATPLQRTLVKAVTYPPSFGALTQLWAGTMPDAVNHNGEFLIPWARLGRCREEAYDPKVGEELWNYLQEQVENFRRTDAM